MKDKQIKQNEQRGAKAVLLLGQIAVVSWFVVELITLPETLTSKDRIIVALAGTVALAGSNLLNDIGKVEVYWKGYTDGLNRMLKILSRNLKEADEREENKNAIHKKD